jgi:hypothetical protein
MHTAICSFEHRDIALRARDRLLESGFEERDVHLQHRGPTDSDAMGEDPRAWEGTDREIAASRGMVDKVAGFFVRLFGADRNPKEHEVYEKAVDRGCTVVVVDTDDEAEAARARALLHDLQAADLNVFHRPDQQRMHEILGHRLPHRSGGLQGSYQDRSSAFDTERAAAERERATASGGPVDKAQAPSAARDWGENGGRDPMADRERRGEAARGDDADLDKVGLRYADKDRPGR